jgi:hypothetical protein
MRVARSRLGWLFVAIYVAVFVAAYLDARAKRGTFLYDIWLDLVALPYILAGRVLLQKPTFEVHGHEPWGLVPAVLFCSAVVLLLGAVIEHGIRGMLGRRAPGGSKTDAR